ncbi:MAG: PEP-CTERM sorting domain-containing protein [Phycisphaerae bacterium]
MKRFLYALLVAGLMMGTAQAGTILLVSDSAATGDHDESFVTWLGSLGHTVDTSGMAEAMREPLDAGDKAAIEAADLVIVSRLTSSGSYDDERKYWNEVDTPLILCSGFLTRGGGDHRWGWTTGGSGDAAKSVTDMDVVSGQEGHVFLNGLTGPVGLFDWSPGTEAPKGVYLPNEGDDHAGTLVGTFDGRPMLMDIAAGTDLDALNGTADDYGTTTARRAFLGHWGYDKADADQWEDYITDDYKTVLGNTVTTLIPEPATLALLGLGAAATLIRRRK